MSLIENLDFCINVYIFLFELFLLQNLQKFLDGAKEGFIYFSLGSNARSSAIPKEIKRIFCNVFAKLPYRVIWKYEEEDLLEKPKNVYIGSWLPQQSILGIIFSTKYFSTKYLFLKYYFYTENIYLSFLFHSSSEN